jgi:enoyl-CoA hydratase/carnithine racemase
MLRFSSSLSLRTFIYRHKRTQWMHKKITKQYSQTVDQKDNFSQKIENWVNKGIQYKYLGNGIGKIVIQHSSSYAPLGLDLMNSLTEALRYLSERHENTQLDDEAKVIILGHTGSTFCSGLDFRELKLASNDQQLRIILGAVTELVETFRRIPLLIIAQVKGLCESSGVQLVAASDLAVATPTSTFSLAYAKFGLLDHSSAVSMLRSNVPRKRLFELLFTGEEMKADEALQYGLLSRIIPENKIEEETISLAEKFALLNRQILSLGKKVKEPDEKPKFLGVEFPCELSEL